MRRSGFVVAVFALLLAGSPSTRAAPPSTPRLVVQIGHAGSIVSGDVHPSGRWLVTGDQAGQAILWDASSGREIRRYLAAGRTATVASFSPDGERVLVRSPQGMDRLYDRASGAPVQRYGDAGVPVRTLAYSPDGTSLLACAEDGRVRLWDVATDTPRFTVELQGEVAYGPEPKPVPTTAAAFTPDGRTLALGLGGSAPEVALLDAATGEIRARFPNAVGHPAHGLELSPDASRVVVRSLFSIALLDTASGACSRLVEGTPGIAAALSADGRFLATGCADRYPDEAGSTDAEAVLWNAETGEEIGRIGPASPSLVAGVPPAVSAVAFSRDGRLFTSGVGEPLRAWTVEPWGPATVLEGAGLGWTWIGVFADGRRLLLGCRGTPALHDLRTGGTTRFPALSRPVDTVDFHPDGRRFLTTSSSTDDDPAAWIWDPFGASPVLVPGSPVDARFPADGRYLITRHRDGTVRVLDLQTRTERHRIVPDPQGIRSLALDADGDRLAVAGPEEVRTFDVPDLVPLSAIRYAASHVRLASSGPSILSYGLLRSAEIVDAQTGARVVSLAGDDVLAAFDDPAVPPITTPHQPSAAAFGPDGRHALTASLHSVRLWDVPEGEEVWQQPSRMQAQVALFSPDGARIALGCIDGTVEVRSARDGTLLHLLDGQRGIVQGLAFSPDGSLLLSGSWDGTARLWDVGTGRDLLRIFVFSDGSWAVVDPLGRYDASRAGEVDGLHWVVGEEPLSLDQLKERYYEPGLLGKVLGTNPEPLRDVGALAAPRLFPRATIEPLSPDGTRFRVHLENRGGGIGRVQVLVGGKEVAADARAAGLDPDAATASVVVDLGGDPRLVAGEANRVEVVVWNEEGYLRSRGLDLEATPTGDDEPRAPALWAVVVGIADYRGTALDLKFAAKDARDFARALQLAAGNLFGDANLHVRVLADGEATREAVLDALDAARAARPEDVLVLYLAGHGVTHGGPEGDFHYLTAEAAGADLADPGLRGTTAIASAELTERITAIPARKQVLVLDTCASGRLVEKLTERREVPASQVRALERLKDRTGVHVIAGCAADRVSYEATRYGQGLLTYSLLLGMRGAALREESFVDVVPLLAFASDRVPELARDIGGIQRPVVASPRGGGSFDIGRVGKEDRERIPLESVRPVFLRSVFQDEDEFRDVLGLAHLVDRHLADVAARGGDLPVVFVDARDLPDAYALVGRYRTEAGRIVVDVRLFHDGERVAAFAVEGDPGDRAQLVARIVAAAQQHAR